MNVLIIGECTEEFCKFILGSRFLSKLYLTSNHHKSELPNIEYSSTGELLRKAKALQIDIAIITDSSFVEDGTVEYLKQHFLNVISVSQKWFNLETSRIVLKQLLNHYSINTPKIILAPNEFPLVFKTSKPICSKVVFSMDDLVKIMAEFSGEKTFLEDYLEGECYSFLTLWDGKNVCYFSDMDVLSEVQQDRLDLLQTKLKFMLFDEMPDFIGFFVVNLIWSKNDWFVLDFRMSFDERKIMEKIKTDFLYILNSAIYQKVQEIK